MYAGRKDGDDSNQVSNQFLRRREAIAMNHDELRIVSLTEGLKVVIAKANEPILMRNENASDLSQFYLFHEPPELLAFVVESTSNVLHPFIDLDLMTLTIGSERSYLLG